ncbi:MAG: TlpA disulfide reductase family protein [Acidimicrobiales bacterium]|nr:TlpA disulfide reductase family protein [Acidimicrobiales bacterium]
MACNASAPELRAAYDIHNAHGFEVLSVSIQEPDAAVDDFVARYGLDYQFLMDRTGEISSAYEVTSTPSTFFIAPDGTIADSTTGVVSRSWLEGNIDDYISS